jgi:Uma2 family endonuclease
MTAVPNSSLTAGQHPAIEHHGRIKANCATAIGIQLKGGQWQSFATGLGIRLRRSGRYSHPDVLIVHGNPELEVGEKAALVNPRVIVEITSEVPEKFDFGKFRQYKQIESLQEYILIMPDEPVFEQYVRQSDGSWTRTDVEGLDREFAFATVPVRIPMADIYAGVVFPEPGG